MRWVIAIAGLMIASTAAEAQKRPITLAADAPYIHKSSGLSVPPLLDGVPRVSATSLAADQLDDYVEFEKPDQSEVITVYIFRHVTGSVPVWFDRVRAQVENRDVYGGVTAADIPASFTPPGQTASSGLVMSFATKSGSYRSTGAAMMPLGPEWFVALRYSSSTLDAPALNQHLRAAINALGWPSKIEPQPAAALVAPCAAPLAYDAGAKPLPANGSSSLLSAILMAGAAKSAPGEAKTPAPVWCRDPAPVNGNAGIYRADGDTTGYLIALGDAGRGVVVAPDTLAALVEKSKKPRWSISYVDVAETSSFPPMDGLPSPARAAQAVNSGPMLSKASTWGDKNEVTISSDALKK